jgi:hypothetical protein
MKHTMYYQWKGLIKPVYSTPTGYTNTKINMAIEVLNLLRCYIYMHDDKGEYCVKTSAS